MISCSIVLLQQSVSDTYHDHFGNLCNKKRSNKKITEYSRKRDANAQGYNSQNPFFFSSSIFWAMSLGNQWSQANNRKDHQGEPWWKSNGCLVFRVQVNRCDCHYFQSQFNTSWQGREIQIWIEKYAFNVMVWRHKGNQSLSLSAFLRLSRERCLFQVDPYWHDLDFAGSWKKSWDGKKVC